MCGSDHAFAGSRSCRSIRSFEALFAGKKVKDLGTRVRMDLLRNLSLHLGAEIGFVDVQHVTCRGRNIGNRSIPATSVPPEDRTPIGPSVNNQIFPAHSTTALADVAASSAALVVEKYSRRRNSTPFGSVVNGLTASWRAPGRPNAG